MKIVQIIHGYSSIMQRPHYMVLCDDGSVWRQAYVEQARPHEDNAGNVIRDAMYVTVWQRAEEFDQIPKEWTPEDENERGR